LRSSANQQQEQAVAESIEAFNSAKTMDELKAAFVATRMMDNPLVVAAKDKRKAELAKVTPAPTPKPVNRRQDTTPKRAGYSNLNHLKPSKLPLDGCQMKIDMVVQGTDEWKELRKRRIGGTRLGDIWSARAYLKKDIVKALEDAKIEFKKSASTSELEEMMPDEARIELLKNAPRKAGFYELIAEYLSIDRDDENRMDRGTRLEPEVRNWFAKTYKKDVIEVGMCMSDADDRIYNSPDGLIRKSPKSKKVHRGPRD
jgi:hypothetical protein